MMNSVSLKREKGIVDVTIDEREYGFSLIELIVTVVIIGIIVAIAIPFFLNAQDSARQAAVDVAARDGQNLARANIMQGVDPHGGDLSDLETDDVILSLASTFVPGDESTVCVRADWIDADNYSISGPCDDGDTSRPIIDREEDDPLYTQLTYRCPTTKTGYLGVVNIGEETRVQIWEERDREGTIREVHYGSPEEDFDLRHRTRKEIVRTQIVEDTGSIDEANAYIDAAIERAEERGIGQPNAPEYSQEETVENASESVEMRGGTSYVVRFDGEIETFSAPGHGAVENVEDSLADCLVSIDHFGDDINLKNIVYLGGENLESVPESIPSSVRSLRGAFENATGFNDPNVSSWNIDNVHSIRSMFHFATSFNQPLPDWGGSVDDAGMMFRGAESFNQNLNSWDMSEITDMGSMFSGATVFNNGDAAGVGNTPLDWDTPKLQRTSGVFMDAGAFNQNLNSWDMSDSITTSNMFNRAVTFNNGDAPETSNTPLTWDVGSAEHMNHMFGNTESFNQDIDSWRPSSAVDMSLMFQHATAFNQPIGSWDVSSAEDMRYMFRGAVNFNQPIGGWNVSNVMDMRYMFYQATDFNQNLRSWTVSQVENSYGFGADSSLESGNMPAFD